MNRQVHTPPPVPGFGQEPDLIPARCASVSAVKPGDRLRYRLTENGVLLDKAPPSETDDPFASFSEWSSEADEKAYGNL